MGFLLFVAELVDIGWFDCFFRLGWDLCQGLYLLFVVEFYPVIDTSKILTHASVLELVDPLHESVEEVSVVTHDDYRTIKVAYRFFENVL